MLSFPSESFSQSHSNNLFFIFLVFGLVLAILIYRQIRVTKLKRMNYSWYLKSHPKNVLNGKVSCHSCASQEIGVERMMQQTYLRRHYCRRCGTNIYYSAE